MKMARKKLAEFNAPEKKIPSPLDGILKALQSKREQMVARREEVRKNLQRPGSVTGAAADAVIKQYDESIATYDAKIKEIEDLKAQGKQL